MHTTATLSVRTLLVVVGLFVTGVLSWHAGADRVAERAPTIGLVDVEKVINGSAELLEFNKQLEADVAKMQTELNDLVGQLSSMEADANELPVTDRENRRNIRKQMFEVQARARVRKEILQNDIDVRKGEAIKVVYDKLIAAVEVVAAREGIDAVLFDDRAIRPRDGMVDEQVNGTIQARRVLYGSPSADMTTRVLDMMNQNFAAGR
jgi:Skp family chaperone for outer membrane proteins